jgi:DNA-binding CsgD family transcriptional regulator
MRSLGIVLSIVTLLGGSFSTISIAVFGGRYGDKGATSLLFPLVPLFSLTLAELLRQIGLISPEGATMARIAVAVEESSRILLAFGWVLASHRILRFCGIVDWRQRLTPLFAILCAAALALYAASRLLVLPFRVDRAINLEVALSLLYAAVSAIVSSWQQHIEMASARVAVAVAGMSLVFYPLVSLADILEFSYPGMEPHVPIWVQTQTLYYAIVVAILAPFVMKHLISAPRAAHSSLLGAESGEARLTERERETVSMLLKGMSYKEIAFSMNVSVATVKTHVNNAYSKLGIKSRAELQAKALPP